MMDDNWKILVGARIFMGKATPSNFSAVDWVVFGATLCVSLFIGFYFACIEKQKTTSQLLVGGRNMGILSTAVSLASTFISSVVVLGVIGEMYAQGTLKAELIVSMMVFTPLSGFLFLPTIFKLKITSTYEYVELRFKSRALRLMSSATFICLIVLYMGILLYVPALTLKAVINFPAEFTMIIIGLAASVLSSLYGVCTAGHLAMYLLMDSINKTRIFLSCGILLASGSIDYWSLFYNQSKWGGFKAVVWSDVFQLFLLLAGMIVIIVQGSINVGGFEEVFKISNEHDRIQFLNFTVDPFTNQSSLNLFFGMGFLYLSSFGSNQARVQRYLGMSTLNRAYAALLLSIPIMVIGISLSVITGLVVFANYAGCDPLSLRLIDSADQIGPYFALEFLSPIKGLLGLFIASIFSSSLSQVSSGINALAACTWEDFFKSQNYFAKMSEGQKLFSTKALTVAFGLLSIAMGFLAREIGSVLSAVIIVNGTVFGPVLGVFLLGVLCPFANSTGAIVGILAGHIAAIWIAVGGILYSQTSNGHLPYEIDQCDLATLSNLDNMTSVLESMKDPTCPNVEWPEKIYTLSYTLYPIVGTAVSVILGSIVSLCTGPTKYRAELEPYLHPWIVTLCSTIRSMREGRRWEDDEWIEQNDCVPDADTDADEGADDRKFFNFCCNRNRQRSDEENEGDEIDHDFVLHRYNPDFISFHHIYDNDYDLYKSTPVAISPSFNVDGGGIL